MEVLIFEMGTSKNVQALFSSADNWIEKQRFHPLERKEDLRRTCSIGGVIVIAKHADVVHQLVGGHCETREDVLWGRAGIFADETRDMCANGVEVAEIQNGPLWIRDGQILQYTI